MANINGPGRDTMIALVAKSGKPGADFAASGDMQTKADRPVAFAQTTDALRDDIAAECRQAMPATLDPERAAAIPLTFIAAFDIGAERVVQQHAQTLPARQPEQIDRRRIAPETGFFGEWRQTKGQRKGIEYPVGRSAALM